MGYGTYEATHNSILEHGKKLFLQLGYEQTNIREICKESGITHGSFYRHFESKEALFEALVKPTVDEIYSIYISSQDACFDLIDENQISDLWNVSEQAVTSIVKFIYLNFDSFKLLLNCATGTKYETFLNELTCFEVESSMRMLQVMHEKKIKVHDLSQNEFHMLSHAFFSCIFEAVSHDYTEEETLLYAHTMADFFSAGWKKVLELI